MAKFASKVVEQAKAWLGYKESNGTHKKIIDVYNSQEKLPRDYPVKATDQWCATFVSAVAVKLGYTDIMPTECSCPYMIEKYKALGCWVENDAATPAPGWVLFYDWDDSGKGDSKGDPEHVGIVEKVVNGKITVIEGNYSNSVKRRTLEVNGKYIRGYGVPKYDAEPKNEKSIDELAREVLAGKYGTGADREKALGDKYDAAQKRVNELLKSNAPTQLKVHTVVRGDTLWAIAKKYLGNGSRYPEIMKLNGLKSTVIHPNQKLKIPNK